MDKNRQTAKLKSLPNKLHIRYIRKQGIRLCVHKTPGTEDAGIYAYVYIHYVCIHYIREIIYNWSDIQQNDLRCQTPIIISVSRYSEFNQTFQAEG